MDFEPPSRKVHQACDGKRIRRGCDSRFFQALRPRMYSPTSNRNGLYRQNYTGRQNIDKGSQCHNTRHPCSRTRIHHAVFMGGCPCYLHAHIHHAIFFYRCLSRMAQAAERIETAEVASALRQSSKEFRAWWSAREIILPVERSGVLQAPKGREIDTASHHPSGIPFASSQTLLLYASRRDRYC